MLAALLDQFGTAEQDSGLRPAEELVAADQDQIGPIAQTLHGGGLAEGRVEGSAPEIVYQVYTSCTCQPGELRYRGHLGEPEEREVRPVDAKDVGLFKIERGGVVGEPRPVGGSDLDQLATGLGENLGHPKSPTNFNEFAATDDGRS